MSHPELLVVAGEASGDLHAARLLSELARLVPGLHAFGVGGDELLAANLEPLAHSRELGVVGISEALSVLGRAREVFARLLAEAEKRHPDAALLVDFPEFNLRLAKRLKQRGVPVVYYVSPQVWAWRRGRVRQIARDIDLMLVLFAFEEEFYRGHGVKVVHVGHPLVDEVPALPQAWDQGPPSGPYRIALLPGSRRSEVEALLPPMLETVKRLAGRLAIWPRLILASTVPRELVDEAMAESGLEVEIVEKKRFAAIADSHLALCASGTATLEVGLLGTPMIVVYKLARWSYWLGKILVRLPRFALVNLVLGADAVPERLQGEVEPEALARLASELLSAPEKIAMMRAALAPLRASLGRPGASARAAAEIAAFLRARGVVA